MNESKNTKNIAGWVKVPKKICYTKNLFSNGTTRHLYLQLLFHADHKGYCFPSIETLQEITGYGRKTIIKHLKILEKEGFIEVKRKNGKVNYYRLCNIPASEVIPEQQATSSKKYTGFNDEPVLKNTPEPVLKNTPEPVVKSTLVPMQNLHPNKNNLNKNNFNKNKGNKNPDGHRDDPPFKFLNILFDAFKEAYKKRFKDEYYIQQEDYNTEEFFKTYLLDLFPGIDLNNQEIVRRKLLNMFLFYAFECRDQFLCKKFSLTYLANKMHEYNQDCGGSYANWLKNQREKHKKQEEAAPVKEPEPEEPEVTKEIIKNYFRENGYDPVVANEVEWFLSIHPEYRSNWEEVVRRRFFTEKNKMIRVQKMLGRQN